MDMLRSLALSQSFHYRPVIIYRTSNLLAPWPVFPSAVYIDMLRSLALGHLTKVLSFTNGGILSGTQSLLFFVG